MYVKCNYYYERVFVKHFYGKLYPKSIFPKNNCISITRPDITLREKDLNPKDIISFKEWCKKVNIEYPFDNYSQVKCIWTNKDSKYKVGEIYDINNRFNSNFDIETSSTSLVSKNQYFVPYFGKTKPGKLTVNDLVKGEIYYSNSNHNNDYYFIFKFDRLGNGIDAEKDYIYTKYQLGYFNHEYFFDKEGLNSAHHANLRLATSEEKQWLEVCIKANKFIPKEKVLKESKPKFEVGKWYKLKANHITDNSRYLKLKEINDDGFIGEYVNKPNYSSKAFFKKTFNYTLIPLDNLQEIQQYLPEGHPDKFKTKTKMYTDEELLEYANGCVYAL